MVLLISMSTRRSLKIASTACRHDENGNWSSFQLANSTPPLSVTGSAIAPSARIHLGATSMYNIYKVKIDCAFVFRIRGTNFIIIDSISHIRPDWNCFKNTNLAGSIVMLGTPRVRRFPLPEIVLWTTASQHPSESQTSECSDLLSRSRATFLIAAQRQPGKLRSH